MRADPVRDSRRAVSWYGRLNFLGSIAVALPLHGQATAPLLAAPRTPLVFRHATVVDVRTGQRMPDQTVIVAGNRTRTVGPAGHTPVPAGAHVVEALGKYLVPGFWDMHVHGHGYVDLDFPLLIANGITGVRDAGSIPPLSALKQWRHEVAVGARVGPRMVVSGPRTFEEYDSTHMWARRDELRIPRAELARTADSLEAAGADMLKTYFYSREGYFAAVRAAWQAGLLVGGHIPQDRNSGQRGLVGGLEASDSGATFLDHEVNPCIVFDDPHPDWTKLPENAEIGRHLDAARCAAAVARFRQNNSWSVVTASLFPNPDSLTGQPAEAVFARVRARLRRFHPDSLNGFGITDDSVIRADAELKVREPRSTADWALRRHWPPLAQLLADGVPMLIGTDMHPQYMYITPGFSFHELMEVLALYGASPLTVLQAVTLSPAKALRATDSLGTVEAGKVADLVLLDADPLVDIWNTTQIRAVVANGRYYDRPALDALLQSAEKAARAAPPFPH